VDPAGQTVGGGFIAGYLYAGDRPVVMTDPSGEMSSDNAAAGLASFAGAITNWWMPARCLGTRCGGVKKPSLVFPFPTGYRWEKCQGHHPTGGLEAYIAIDFCTDPSTPVLAVESGVLFKWSGHEPPWVDQVQGIFGWTLYLRGDSGTEYFYTHLGSRIAEPRGGQRRVTVGQKIGKVGFWPNDRPRSHLHLGAAGGSSKIDAVANAPRVGL
jgi:murein DD-endopeptidase MepM/ murein hydrolase activator NlpD